MHFKGLSETTHKVEIQKKLQKKIQYQIQTADVHYSVPKLT